MKVYVTSGNDYDFQWPVGVAVSLETASRVIDEAQAWYKANPRTPMPSSGVSVNPVYYKGWEIQEFEVDDAQ